MSRGGRRVLHKSDHRTAFKSCLRIVQSIDQAGGQSCLKSTSKSCLACVRSSSKSCLIVLNMLLQELPLHLPSSHNSCLTIIRQVVQELPTHHAWHILELGYKHSAVVLELSNHRLKYRHESCPIIIERSGKSLPINNIC